MSEREDEQGRELYLRCRGICFDLFESETLEKLQKLMDHDLENALADIGEDLSNGRKHYNKMWKKETNARQKLDSKKQLDRQDAWIEQADQVRDFRELLLKDLKDLTPRFRSRNI